MEAATGEAFHSPRPVVAIIRNPALDNLAGDWAIVEKGGHSVRLSAVPSL